MDKMIDILTNKQTALSTIIADAKVAKIIEENYQGVILDLKKDLSFGFVKEGTLYLYAKNPAWHQEIKCHKREILERIDQIFNQTKNPIIDIKIKIE